VTPIGPELRSTGKVNLSATPPTPEQRRQMAEGSVAAQSETSLAAAQLIAAGTDFGRSTPLPR